MKKKENKVNICKSTFSTITSVILSQLFVLTIIYFIGFIIFYYCSNYNVFNLADSIFPSIFWIFFRFHRSILSTWLEFVSLIFFLQHNLERENQLVKTPILRRHEKT